MQNNCWGDANIYLECKQLEHSFVMLRQQFLVQVPQEHVVQAVIGARVSPPGGAGGGPRIPKSIGALKGRNEIWLPCSSYTIGIAPIYTSYL